MYRYVAGNANAPGVFQLLGYEDEEEVPSIAIQFPLLLRTTAVNPEPPDISTALMNEIERGVEESLLNATRSQQSAIDASDAANTAFDNATDAHTWAEGTDEEVEALGGEHSAKGWADIVPTISIPQADKGQPDGVATLDNNGKIPLQQIPDDVGQIDNVSFNGTMADIENKVAKIAATLAGIPGDAAHRTVTDEQIDAWNNKSDFSGSYNDLTNKPHIPTSSDYIPQSDKGIPFGVPTLDNTGKVPLSQLPESQGEGAIDAITFNDAAVPVENKVAKITADIPSRLSELAADSGHRTVTDTQIGTWNNKSDFSGNYNDLSNKPFLFSGSYNDLTDKPDIPTKLSELISDEMHRTVTDLEKSTWSGKSDFSGSYADLTNKPSIPTALSELTSDADHRTVTDAEKTTWNNKSDFSGSYNDLTDKPSLDYIPQTAKGSANGVAPLDSNSLVPDENLPALAPLPLHLNAAPTTSTVGVFGQHAIVDSTGKEYTCVAVTTADDVTTYTWVDDINEKGGNFTAPITIEYAYYRSIIDNSSAAFGYAVTKGDYGTITAGFRSNGLGRYYSIVVGDNVEQFAGQGANAIFGDFNKKDEDGILILGNGTSSARSNALLVSRTGDLYIAGGHQQGITVIPAATTSYTLSEGCFSHTPAEASTYTFPAVTNTTRTHQIRLTLDFTTVQTYAFQDSQGNAIAPLFTPTIAAGDVYEFRCEYSAVQSRWLIYPCKQGAVSDDYVMQAEVGAANGVAGLDANGKVPSTELPMANSTQTPGIGKAMPNGGVGCTSDGQYHIVRAHSSEIATRQSAYLPIVASMLNIAVTAALTDANHITLTSEQQATAQSVIGIDAPIVFTTAGEAPTTSTVGTPGRRAVNTADGKAWTCTAVNVDETDPQNPVTTYTWTDDINAMGGTFNNNAEIKINNTYGLHIKNGLILAGYSNSANAGWGLVVGNGNNIFASHGSIALGNGLRASTNTEILMGEYNVPMKYMTRIAGGGKGSPYECLNIEELTPQGTLYVAGGHQQGITIIPSATTAYTLAEGMQSHIPSDASIYTFPEIVERIVADNYYYVRYPANDGAGYYAWNCAEDNNRKRYTASETPSVGDNTYTNTALTSGAKPITAIDNRTHECVLDVKFDNVQTLVFQDADGNVIEPQDDIDIQQGDVWRFLCQWNTLLECWCIMPVRLQNKTILPPVLSISPSSYNVSGNAGSALTSLDLSPNVTVLHPATGASLSFSSSDLPAGVSISSAGVISGTPTAQGTTTSTVTIAYPNATSITCTVVFTIAAPAVMYYYTVSGAQNLQNADTGDITNVNVLGDYYLHSGTHGSTDAVYTNGTFYFQLDPRENAWDIIGSPVSDWSEMPGPMFVGLYQIAASGNTPPTGAWDASNGSVLLDGANLMAQASTTATVSAYGA